MVWLRSAVFATAFVAAMYVWLPGRILAATGRPAAAATGAPLVGGLLLLGAGVAVSLWCVGAFGAHGRGTPAPFDPPRRLVVRGPYRYVRNPMYLAGVLVLLGEAALFTSLPLLAYAVLFWLAAHLLVVGYEERRLARAFGPDYAAYRATVSRWVPRRVREPAHPRAPAG